MAPIEGTYTCVKGEEWVDFYLSLGATKEEAQSFSGSHWTMKMWKDGESSWGGQVTCKEHPAFNCVDVWTDGVEKNVDHFLYGGKGKLLLKKNPDGFTTVVDTEKFGKIVWEEKYTDEGVQFSVSTGDKTIKEFWERCVNVDGSYLFDKGENIEAYCNAMGGVDASVMDSFKHYKVKVCQKGNTFCTKEYFGGKTICNSMTFDVEAPFNYPDDKEGEPPKRRGLVTKAGVGKYLLQIKSPDGNNEEWTMCFTDCGLVMTGTEQKTGQTCKFYTKRVNDISGTFKMVTALGFEKFAESMGAPCSFVQNIMSDCSGNKFVICDKGNGCQRHQYICKNQTMADFTLNLNEEFSFFDPMTNEEVKAVVVQNESMVCITGKFSKGTVTIKMQFNCNFVVSSISMPGTHLECKVIYERECCH